MNPGFQPPTGGVFAAAMQWLQATLLGSLAMAVAIIAVACVGLMLLTGRVEIRRGVQVIIGCFILFGASSIAANIMRLGANQSSAPAVAQALPPPPSVIVQPPTAEPVKSAPYDPYAGAALPARP